MQQTLFCMARGWDMVCITIWMKFIMMPLNAWNSRSLRMEKVTILHSYKQLFCIIGNCDLYIVSVKSYASFQLQTDFLCPFKYRSLLYFCPFEYGTLIIIIKTNSAIFIIIGLFCTSFFMCVVLSLDLFRMQARTQINWHSFMVHLMQNVKCCNHVRYNRQNGEGRPEVVLSRRGRQKIRFHESKMNWQP